MIPGIFNSSKIIEKAMDASWIRNEVIAENIANVNTPGYKKKTVAFEEFLQQVMNGSDNDKKDMDNLEIKVIQDNDSLSMRLDGNNVDIENETADLAKNSIKYAVLQQSISAQLKRLKCVIEGRG